MNYDDIPADRRTDFSCHSVMEIIDFMRRWAFEKDGDLRELTLFAPTPIAWRFYEADPRNRIEKYDNRNTVVIPTPSGDIYVHKSDGPKDTVWIERNGDLLHAFKVHVP